MGIRRRRLSRRRGGRSPLPRHSSDPCLLRPPWGEPGDPRTWAARPLPPPFPCALGAQCGQDGGDADHDGQDEIRHSPSPSPQNGVEALRRRSRWTDDRRGIPRHDPPPGRVIVGCFAPGLAISLVAGSGRRRQRPGPGCNDWRPPGLWAFRPAPPGGLIGLRSVSAIRGVNAG